LWAAVERGLGYTDITPHLTELGRGAAYDKINAAARASGARLVLGTGIVPGISNVMVRALANALGGADEIETALLLVSCLANQFIKLPSPVAMGHEHGAAGQGDHSKC
jgi:saccharopine dehydrogenase-like NADP-dependent oxidoreductase